MKILIVGELSERQLQSLQERWVHVPGAELIFVKSVYQEPEPDIYPIIVCPNGAEPIKEEWGYIDDVQFIHSPPAPNEPGIAPKTGRKAIRQEKTAPVWTRRKKR